MFAWVNDVEQSFKTLANMSTLFLVASLPHVYCTVLEDLLDRCFPYLDRKERNAPMCRGCSTCEVCAGSRQMSMLLTSQYCFVSCVECVVRPSKISKILLFDLCNCCRYGRSISVAHCIKVLFPTWH